MTTFIQEAWHTTLLLAPWLFLGAFSAGLVHKVLPAGWMKRHFNGPSGVLKAVTLGIPMPLCSCGVIPAGLSIKKQGGSSGASMAFMISTPQTGIDSILVAASFLGWPLAIFKVALAAVTGIVGGLLGDDINSGKVMTPRSPLQSNQRHHLAGKMPIYTHKILSTQSGDGWSLAFYSQQPLPPFSHPG